MKKQTHPNVRAYVTVHIDIKSKKTSRAEGLKKMNRLWLKFTKIEEQAMDELFRNTHKERMV
jgi:hypothetical protein